MSKWKMLYERDFQNIAALRNVKQSNPNNLIEQLKDKPQGLFQKLEHNTKVEKIKFVNQCIKSNIKITV